MREVRDAVSLPILVNGDISSFSDLVQAFNSHKNYQINMAAQYAHLHIMTNNPAKYESNPESGYRGVAMTRILAENNLSPITPTKIIKSTWRHSMPIYTS